VHNASQWSNLRHLGEPLGGAEGLLETVSFISLAFTVNKRCVYKKSQRHSKELAYMRDATSQFTRETSKQFGCPALIPFIRVSGTARTVSPPRGCVASHYRGVAYENSSSVAVWSHCNPATGRLNGGLTARLSPLIELIATGVDV